MDCNHCGSQSHGTRSSNCPKILHANEPGHSVQQVRSSRTFSDQMYSNRMQLMRCPGRPTSPLRASRVLNTRAPTVKARSNRMATNETTALECSECGSTTNPLRASRVLNTRAPIAKARSNRRAAAETTALECKPRYATNAAKLATARTNAPFFSCSAYGLRSRTISLRTDGIVRPIPSWEQLQHKLTLSANQLVEIKLARFLQFQTRRKSQVRSGCASPE
jgi:hypothetical protein